MKISVVSIQAVGLCAACLMILGCPKPELVDTKRAQPLPPLAYDTLPSPGLKKAYEPVPKPGSDPLVRITKYGRPFRGDSTFQVQFDGTKFDSLHANLLTARTVGKGPAESTLVGFALPEKMSLRRPSSDVYNLRIRMLSSLMGADESLKIVDSSGRLYAGYIWSVNPDSAITFLLEQNLVLTQEPLMMLPTADTLVMVPVSVRKPGSVHQPPAIVDTNIVIGKVFQFQSDGKWYAGFIRTSAYRHVARSLGDASKGYILRALVVLVQ